LPHSEAAEIVWASAGVKEAKKLHISPVTMASLDALTDLS
jgi:hypothetical protein